MNAEAGVNKLRLSAGEERERYIHVISAGGTPIEAPQLMGFNRLAGVPDEWPLYWPPSQGTALVDPAGMHVLKSDEGDIEVMCIVDGVAMRSAVGVRGEDLAIYVEVDAPFRIVFDERVMPPIWWSEGVKFEKDGVSLPEAEFGLRTMGGKVQGIVALSRRPDRVYIPELRGVDVEGGWHWVTGGDVRLGVIGVEGIQWY